MPLSSLHPLVAAWFESTFAGATEPQRQAWPLIHAGHDVLISAPTGHGKTLAAFLICLDGLVRQACAGTLGETTSVLYVSPLKALSNDVHKNLDVPLAGIRKVAAEQHPPLAEIRTAVRTGDTSQRDRQQMLAHPPHVLVTTPESLYLLMTSEKGRAMLAGIRTVIVDEIHAVADDKRGSHLALTLARLNALVKENGNRCPQRIGLSATVKPIEEVASFLGPEVKIVQAGHKRQMDLRIMTPRDELGPVATNEMWGDLYDQMADLIVAHRTSLVFVNTRRLAERVSHHLTQRLRERIGENAVLPHHGSLSRELRMEAEQQLKKGHLRAVVATASLELGIDIGTADLVIQVGSPRSIAVALQRIGRSGHSLGALPKGRVIASTRDELVECAALVRAIHERELDRLEIPDAPLDVLAQQMVAEAACRELGEEELFDLVRSAWPYRNLERAQYAQVLEMLTEGVASSRGRRGAWLHWDRVNHRVRGRRGARLTAITNGGAIPDNANYLVVSEPEGTVVGTLDEDFAMESMAGDVFLLGTTSWRIRRIEAGRVRVEDAHGAAPSIPFWNGEAPGRTFELSEAVSRLREEIAAMERKDAVAFLDERCGLDAMAGEQAFEYVCAGAVALGAIPATHRVVAERFFDEAGGMQLVIHAPFGSRINRAWGLALRKRFCRTFNFELQAAATDNGIVISLSHQHAFPLENVFAFLRPETVEPVLRQALLDAPMFTARWRWNASRALAVLRFRGGAKVPPPIQRMQSDDLLATVFPDQAACAENLTGEIRIPDHPLVNETIGNCLREAMDVDGLRRVIAGITSGSIAALAIDTVQPSPFCHEILNANPYAYLDDAPLEERRARAVQLRRVLPESGDIASLDAAAIEAVREESWPVVRDADELHDAMLTLIALPERDGWREWFTELSLAQRATVLAYGGKRFWVSAERLAVAELVYVGAAIDPAIASAAGERYAGWTREEAVLALVRGWLESTGPWTTGAIADVLAVAESDASIALAQLEGQGLVLRGKFTPGSVEIEWCDRRLLARIHRLTLARLRREIEPVTTAEFMVFLARWQHVAAGTRLHEADGLLHVIRQLQGYEIPASAWESEILPRRVAGYRPELLDTLCLAGEVMWGRLSPHPAFQSAKGARRATEQERNTGLGFAASSSVLRVLPKSKEPRRVRPTRVAPVALFLREDAGWLLPSGEGETPALSHPARDVLSVIEQRGASFFAEIVHHSTRLASEVEDALWELVAAGMVTADGFENLRSLIDPKRRRGEGRGRSARPRHAAGRWALLHGAAWEAPASSDAGLFRCAGQLLDRWGVVFRDLIVREALAPPWRELLVALRRMEAKGEVRGGRFVAGYPGEQYARAEALDLLRMVRRGGGKGEEMEVGSSDPLHLTGVLLPGARVHPYAGERLYLMDGVPVDSAPAAGHVKL
ncbi:MAG: DEAD/DEAH box helicase [Acidobacteriia bacterium]|nr:DEAD/DEAH box helicase [Terriglobia bacterium]